jgi:subtilisin family serine protease
LNKSRAPIVVVACFVIAFALLSSPVPKATNASAVGMGVADEVAQVHLSDHESNLVVELGTPEALASVQALASLHGAETTYLSGMGGMIVLDPEGDVSSLASEIAAVEGVTSVSSERKVRTLFTPSDPEISRQWGLEKVNAYDAWDLTLGSHSVVVAVLDTGIDWNHPDLAANMWTNDDGYHGYNFIDNNWLPMDDNIHGYDDDGIWQANLYTYHGTHVAGIVGAVTNNAVGVAGLAQVQLVAIKVMNESGEGTDALVADGIDWAVDVAHADIIVMSLGVDGESFSLRRAVNNARDEGVVMVAAAGNDGTSVVSYPAAYGPVIAVGATDSSDRRATFSNYGSNLDIMAPGVMIYSTQGGDSYQHLSGTSAAAPHVAGVAALMMSIDPALMPEELGEVLNATATDISQSGYDPTTGWGIVDAFGAAEAISSPRVTITEYPDFVEPNATYSVSWMVSGGDPGVIESTTLYWGESLESITHPTESFTGMTWAVFTANDLPSLAANGTIYLRATAIVDGSDYQSAVKTVPVHEATQDNIFLQFIDDVQDFIFEEMGLFNFLLLIAILIAIPIIIVAARPKRRRAAKAAARPPTAAQTQAARTHSALNQYHQAPATAYAPPPPPPPPRYESYVDIVGDKIVPPVLKVLEGTKVVWVNRTWAPPPGVAVKSGHFSSAGEKPDSLFSSGLLVAPGDYWSVTFHRVGTYEYYVTGVWKSAKVVVEPAGNRQSQTPAQGQGR